jgi:phospholipid/cholesterol/gamma-HCH transport system permease protein
MSATTAADPPRLDIEEQGDDARVVAAGEWLLDNGQSAERLIDQVTARPKRHVVMDLSKVAALDTAGAWLLHRLRAQLEFAGARVELTGLPEYRRQLIEEIEGHVPEPWAPHRRPASFKAIPEAVGRRTVMIAEDLFGVLNVLGAFISGLAYCILNPRKLRITAILANFDTTGRGAVPIMALMSFLIGAIIAQQGAFYLRRFGAEVFVVDLVGVLALREIGVILTAVMFAGRSGSAFTAEIGSMKMREEIDALHVMGMSPVEVLIIPRLLALMVALPALTFVSDIAALIGAGFVCLTYVGMPLDTFLTQLQEAIDLETLMVGIIKAPFMALIIGLIACVEGLKVEGSAESLGRQTTISVVKSIFMVIVIDGIFAVFFAAIGV